MLESKKIGLIVVGDEILSGRRQDTHLSKIIELLNARGLNLSWARFLPDDLEVLTEEYKRSLASGDIVFSSGGIGATPDDKTRQAIADALGVPLELNHEAAELIHQRAMDLARQGLGTEDMGAPENQRRLAMGVFPVGSEIIPNNYNKIPGFYICNHSFVPGFPEMAWPMIEWTLDTRYKDIQILKPPITKSIIVYSIPESRLTAALEYIETKWDEVRTFSLPTVARDGKPPFIDVGVKGYSPFVEEAFDYLRGAILRVGGHFHP